MLELFKNLPPIYLGITLSMLAGMATGLGALPLLFIRKRFSGGIIDASLGFAAGVMLAATAFSLVLASIEEGGIIPLIVGMTMGVLFVDRMDKIIPHDHFVKGHEGPGIGRLRKIWLFVFTIIIHNFPEGLAVGVGGFSKHAYSLAFAIGAQNIPEGLAVAAALAAAEYKVGYAVLIAFLSGLAEPVGGILGAGLVGISSSILPYALAFAGGAMLFVISDEVIPETHSGDHQRLATFSLVAGFILMTILDTLL
ncbi:ZIP family metal transporter [Biomaibacter acetigenes]|uniref:ZIP family metal transporter n=1 Tax=Biomaibacter acetigenes TaxID=2316383 RepID=A0A3G2R3L1_9FIRM|nr:ZIP family metal transporter [Biomaibacter acetigenes]AYO29982.1 ZIP family metal transporter [Biomaibacter acetigenes]